MNEFLKTRSQVDDATKWLRDNNLTESGLSCKNWELTEATKELTDGNILDMGADGSYVLHNAVKKGIHGSKTGIDLLEVTGTNRAEGVEYFKGDLMNTPFPDEAFNTVFSLSVLEHQVNLNLFAKEVSRILGPLGKLIVSFDYAPEKIDTSLTKLYSLDWNVLSTDDVRRLIDECEKQELKVFGQIDWTIQDMVITPQFCSPAQCSYTFGILKFIKE